MPSIWQLRFINSGDPGGEPDLHFIEWLGGVNPGNGITAECSASNSAQSSPLIRAGVMFRHGASTSNHVIVRDWYVAGGMQGSSAESGQALCFFESGWLLGDDNVTFGSNPVTEDVGISNSSIITSTLLVNYMVGKLQTYPLNYVDSCGGADVTTEIIGPIITDPLECEFECVP